jgi:DNA-binding transcriptional LysR family regulator
MDVTDVDLRLLRVFKAVADSGGLSNAQELLNLNPSTISTKLSTLEAQLGYTLCQRGRSGFKLTEQGAKFYRHVVDLMQSLQVFKSQTAELSGGLNGYLRIGFLDNVIGDPESPLREAIGRFARQSRNRVNLVVNVLGPRELERDLFEGSIDVAFGIFFNELPGLTYRPINREREVLVCHRSHALSQMRDAGDQARAIPQVAKVIRGFMGNREFPFSGVQEGDLPAGNVTNVEAAAMLILSGEYIGFLPAHYANAWIQRGEMIPLLPDRFVRYSQFSLVTRAHAALTSGALRAFLSCFDESDAVQPTTKLGASVAAV